MSLGATHLYSRTCVCTRLGDKCEWLLERERCLSLPVFQMSLLPATLLTDGVVRLRPWNEADIPWLIECIKDPEIPRWTRLGPNFDHTKGAEFVARAMDATQRIMLAIEEVATGNVMGGVNIGRVGVPPPYETVRALQLRYTDPETTSELEIDLMLPRSPIFCQMKQATFSQRRPEGRGLHYALCIYCATMRTQCCTGQCCTWALRMETFPRCVSRRSCTFSSMPPISAQHADRLVRPLCTSSSVRHHT